MKPSISAPLASLEARVTSLEAELRRMRTLMEQRFAQLSGTVNARFVPVEATFDTLENFEPSETFWDGPPLATDGTPWTATLSARAAGSAGNDLRLAIFQGEVGVTEQIEVRDNEAPIDGSWEASPGTIGIAIVQADPQGFTVGMLETAINATSSLGYVSIPDPLPSKILPVNDNFMSGSFTGGADFR